VSALWPFLEIFTNRVIKIIFHGPASRGSFSNIQGKAPLKSRLITLPAKNFVCAPICRWMLLPLEVPKICVEVAAAEVA